MNELLVDILGQAVPLLVTLMVGVASFFLRQVFEARRIETAANQIIAEKIENFSKSNNRIKNYQAAFEDHKSDQVPGPFRYTPDDHTVENQVLGEVIKRLPVKKIKRISRVFRHLWLMDEFLVTFSEDTWDIFTDPNTESPVRAYKLARVKTRVEELGGYLDRLEETSGTSLFNSDAFSISSKNYD